MKKITIIYSTAGMGHKKAAMALLKNLQDRNKGSFEVKAIDLSEYASRFYRFLYVNFYIFVITRARWLWWIIYYIPNHPLFDAIFKRSIEYSDLCNLRELKNKLVEEDPDVIIATHFLLPGIARYLKAEKGFHAKVYAVVTDYGPHSYWLSEYVDGYFVGAEYTFREMLKRGIPAGKMKATGIPSEGDFGKEFDIGAMRAKYKLDEKKRTVFLLSGGFGVGPMEKILLSLNRCRSDIQVITVCGHNEELYKDIARLKEELDYPVVLFGFTDKVAELMAVSDLMIGKAGGISVTEALNSRLPIVLFASVPGQETWNENLLLAGKAAKKARRVSDIPLMVDQVLLSEEELERLKKGIESIRRPDAAERITDAVLKDIGVNDG